MSLLQHDLRIPRGVSDKLPRVAQHIRDVEAAVLRTTHLWGYQFVQPSPLEFEDVLALGMGLELTGKAFRFDDWESMRLLAIPPDITPQIARISATRLQDINYPHRLSYSGVVLRHSEMQSGHQREIFQAGAELIGKKKLDADVEVLMMVFEIAKECKLEAFTINISHVGVCQGVLDLYKGSHDELKILKRAIALKDTSAVSAICDKKELSSDVKEQFLRLTRLFGGVAIFDHVQDVCWNNTTAEAIREIQTILTLLRESGVDIEAVCTFDLGETRGLEYHTGISFECYAPASGDTLFSGGRYDTLMERYGVVMPATGFTCDVIALARAVGNRNNFGPTEVDLLVVTGSNDLLDVVKRLRLRGISVVVEKDSWSYETAYMHMQNHNIKFLLMVDSIQSKLVRSSDSREWILDCLFTDDFIAQIVTNN